MNANPFNIANLRIRPGVGNPRADDKAGLETDCDDKAQQRLSAALPEVGLWPWIRAWGPQIADPLLNWLLQEMLANVPNAFSTVQLKQFRDPSSPTDACYQAVVDTPFTLSNIGAPTALPPVTITVEQYASLDIPGRLGFPAGVPLQPALQYAVTLDMSTRNATNLFVNSQP